MTSDLTSKQGTLEEGQGARSRGPEELRSWGRRWGSLEGRVLLRAKLHLIRVGRSLEPWVPQQIITDDHRHPGATLSGGGHFGAESLENQEAQTEPQILLQSFSPCRGSLVFGRGGHCHLFTQPASIYCISTGTGTEGCSVETHRSLRLRREVLNVCG